MPPGRKKLPSISVVIAAPSDYQHSHGFTLHDTITSLRKQNYPSSRVELIVSASGMDKASIISFKKKYPRIQIVNSPPHGYFHLKNLGIKKARGEIIALADADCTYKETWLSSISEKLKEGYDLSAGFSVVEGNGIANRLASFYTMHSMLLRFRKRVWRFNSHNIAFRREVILPVMYDERFERFGGCLQLAWNLNRKGFRMGFDPRQAAVHNYYGFGSHSWQAAICNGYEIFEVRRKDKSMPLASLTRLWLLSPPFFTLIFFASDIVNLLQNRRLMGIRWYELPLFVLFSLSGRLLEMVGMFWTLLSRRSMLRFIAGRDTR